MAMINCPECGKEISDKAKSCPNCGYPIANDYYKNNYDDEIENAEEYSYEAEDKSNDALYGVISLLLSIIATLLSFAINDGILLVIPFVIYVVSAIIGIEHKGRCSILGLILSAAGVALIFSCVLIK